MSLFRRNSGGYTSYVFIGAGGNHEDDGGGGGGGVGDNLETASVASKASTVRSTTSSGNRIVVNVKDNVVNVVQVLHFFSVIRASSYKGH